MSVKTWKRVITLAVIAIIISLIAVSVFLLIKYGSATNAVKEIQNSPTIIDLSEYGLNTKEETQAATRYLKLLESADSIEYQEKYDDLYIDNDFEFTDDTSKKICYLTFDDGPNVENTTRILDALKEYDAKATFFVIYKDSKAERALYRRIVEEGHTLAVHSASHSYDKIYASVENFLDDFDRISRQIEDSTGVKPEIFRFPGGSVNGYNMAISQELIAEMLRRGYVFYDWNSSSGDAAGASVSKSEIVSNVLNTGTKQKKKIVLLHDGSGHKATADALPEILEGLLDQGYELRALDNSVKPICFAY